MNSTNSISQLPPIGSHGRRAALGVTAASLAAAGLLGAGAVAANADVINTRAPQSTQFADTAPLTDAQSEASP